MQTMVPRQITAAPIKLGEFCKYRYASAMDQIHNSKGLYSFLPLFTKPLWYDVKQCQ